MLLTFVENKNSPTKVTICEILVRKLRDVAFNIFWSSTLNNVPVLNAEEIFLSTYCNRLHDL
jgi:hypothetical protein